MRKKGGGWGRVGWGGDQKRNRQVNAHAFVKNDPLANYPLVSPRMHISERQITHLICARLKYDLYDFFRGCFGAFYTRKAGSRPRTPLKKAYRSYFRRAQIRWVIWRSSSIRKVPRNFVQKSFCATSEQKSESGIPLVHAQVYPRESGPDWKGQVPQHFLSRRTLPVSDNLVGAVRRYHWAFSIAHHNCYPLTQNYHLQKIILK